MDAFGVVWANLARYVVGTAPVSQVIAEVIDVCEAERAHPSWVRLRTLRWDEGQQVVARWVRDLMANQPPPPEARGLWFGISTPVDHGQARSDLYFGATRDYEPDDAELEWVFSGFYYPGTHPHPACLAEMYRIAYDDPNGLGNDAEWPLALAFGCAAVARALRALPVPVTLANDSLGVVCGFDGGDFIFLGELRADGFDAQPRVL